MTADPDNPESSIERHYTLEEIREKLHVSKGTARNLFAKEKGLVKIGQPSRREAGKYKRRRYIWRIPESVFQRVYGRLLG